MALTPAYRYRGFVRRVIDADTFEIVVDLGFRASITIPVRLRGYNAPELSTPEGKAAAAHAAQRLMGCSVLVESYKDKQSFARWVADVWTHDGIHVGELLGLQRL